MVFKYEWLARFTLLNIQKESHWMKEFHQQLHRTSHSLQLQECQWFTSYEGQSIWESKLWSLHPERWTIRFQQLLVIGSLNTYNFLTDWQRSTYSSYYSYIHIPCMEDSVSTYCIPLAEHCKTHITTVKHAAPAINTFKFQGSFLGLEKWWRNGLMGKSPCCSFQVSASAWRILGYLTPSSDLRQAHTWYTCMQTGKHTQ